VRQRGRRSDRLAAEGIARLPTSRDGSKPRLPEVSTTFCSVRRWTWWLGLFLGCLLIVDGIAETVRLVRSGDGGLFFWFPTLVGGGLLIVSGTLAGSRRPVLGLVLTCLGCIAGFLPTMWTLLVPVLLVVLVVSRARQTAEVIDRRRATDGLHGASPDEASGGAEPAN